VIDLKQLRDDPEPARASQRARGEDPALVDALLAADEARRTTVSRADSLRAEQKSVSASVRSASAEDRPRVLEQAKALAQQVKDVEAEQAQVEADLKAAQLAVPNVIVGAPPGGEADFVVLEQYGEIPSYDFTVKDHLDIGTILGAIDTERGAKVSGSRFAFLTGPGALLELALVNLAMSHATANGFVPMIAPALVRPEAMEGTGFLGAHAAEVYKLENDDLYLVGTSEVPLAAYHSGEVLESVPRRYAGFSSCFRREAGSHGKDTRGIIRVHQFDKVEMFSFVEPDMSRDEHDFILAREEELMTALELPYRVVNIAAGDLGAPASKKYDIEVWLPGQQAYRELTSCSNCTDYQARRLKARVRRDKGTEFVHTLNGTALAIGRTLVAIFENHQQEDGTIRVPEVLHEYGAPKVVSQRRASVTA
jgi:seryl-tRNA synthetase